jgi:hypothetical protein
MELPKYVCKDLLNGILKYSETHVIEILKILYEKIKIDNHPDSYVTYKSNNNIIGISIKNDWRNEPLVVIQHIKNNKLLFRTFARNMDVFKIYSKLLDGDINDYIIWIRHINHSIDNCDEILDTLPEQIKNNMSLIYDDIDCSAEALEIKYNEHTKLERLCYGIDYQKK